MATEITFKVKFEDGKVVMMTPRQIDNLRDRRRYIVFGHKGEPILKKVYKG